MIGRNNIFNIRSGRRWLGSVGSTRGFVDFSSRDYCIRAWLKLMRTYRMRGIVSLERIVSTFAPPTENDTKNYIGYCCDILGCTPGYRLGSDNDYFRLAQPMAFIETSTLISVRSVELCAACWKIIIVSNHGRV